jgi:hypothetical protein
MTTVSSSRGGDVTDVDLNAGFDPVAVRVAALPWHVGEGLQAIVPCRDRASGADVLMAFTTERLLLLAPGTLQLVTAAPAPHVFRGLENRVLTLSGEADEADEAGDAGAGTYVFGADDADDVVAHLDRIDGTEMRWSASHPRRPQAEWRVACLVRRLGLAPPDAHLEFVTDGVRSLTTRVAAAYASVSARPMSARTMRLLLEIDRPVHLAASVCGYLDSALALAAEHDVALFHLDQHGRAVPVSDAAWVMVAVPPSDRAR